MNAPMSIWLCIYLLVCVLVVIRADDEITAELETRATVSLSSHQRLFRAEGLLSSLSHQLNLDIFGQAWNKASVDQRKDMITILLEDDSSSVVPSNIYEKRYQTSAEHRISLATDDAIDSQTSLLELYDGMQDIHRLIFLQEAMWPKLDQDSQQAIYSFLEVAPKVDEKEKEKEKEKESGNTEKDSRSNAKINMAPVVCPSGNVLIGRSCHQVCGADSECTEWCSCDMQAYPGLIGNKGVCTCRCDAAKYTTTKTCKNVPKSLPEANLVCLEWFDFGICGMGAAAGITPPILALTALIFLLFALF